LRKLAVQRLESLQSSGLADLPRFGRPRREPTAEESLAPDARGGGCTDVEQEISVPSSESQHPHSSAGTDSATARAAAADRSLSRQQCAEALATLCRQVSSCTRCAELADTRTQTVFGTGDPTARLLFLGEAPGADEDRQGEPFVGRAGQLLNKIIQACTLRRDQVYILNILKCRPPGNRNPTPAEAANCRDYLLEQLRIIQPEYICCLGAIAAQNLLETTTPIGRLRGRFHDFQGIKVIATYHPAYLLRNPGAKRSTWDDMKMLMRDMGIEIPKAGSGG
jgi:DNA polymerase